LVYGGRHAVYKKTVEGKTLIMPVPAHPGTLILATYIKSLNDLFQFTVSSYGLRKVGYYKSIETISLYSILTR
jgi:hypothetical protein